MQQYDVIIVGGGPTGVALAIELGLADVRTLVLEKHEAPMLSPRAQSLNARSMEFFRRWQLSDTLKKRQLLPPDFPIRGVWCSQLNGKTYATSSSNDQLNDDISPERGVRIPLWLTEEVLRDKLATLPCVTFLKRHAVVDVQCESDHVRVTVEDAPHQQHHFQASYVIACDGANSITRRKMGIPFEALAPPQRVVNIVFEAPDLERLITVDKGFLFYLLESTQPGALGPVDVARGLWYAQIRGDNTANTIEDVNLDDLLYKLTGLQFTKKIIDAHFWDMHIQLAEHFSYHNLIFLVGDSAHAFAPTGGFGLNTGLGDVVNLGWKLAAVIKHHADPHLLATYEQERRPVCLQNLKAAQKNADDLMTLRQKHDPRRNPDGFAKANAALAAQHMHSLGLTMGYAYFDSPLTTLQPNQSTQPPIPSVYDATVAPGYFLPHRWITSGQTIYDLLSPTHWTWIVSGSGAVDDDATIAWQKIFSNIAHPLATIHLPEATYPFRYILVRPDWHIAAVQ